LEALDGSSKHGRALASVTFRSARLRRPSESRGGRGWVGPQPSSAASVPWVREYGTHATEPPRSCRTGGSMWRKRWRRKRARSNSERCEELGEQWVHGRCAPRLMWKPGNAALGW